MRLPFALLCLLLLATPAAQAGDFRLDAGTTKSLVITMPDGWRADTSTPDGQPIRTLRFTPRLDNSFLVLLTVIPLPPSPDRAPLSHQDLRDAVVASAAKARETSVETVLTPIDLMGAEVSGVYFTATDRAPGPGGFRHLTQGGLRAGDAVVNFTLLANDDVPGGLAVWRRTLLEALRNGRLQPR